MKTIRYLFALFAFTTFLGLAKAQADTLPRKNKGVFEAGFNLASMTIRPGNFHTRYHPIMDNQAFSGLYLKYHTGKNALRLEFNFSQRNLRYDAPYGASFSKSKATTKSLELKMGYQRSLINRKLSFYYFADLEYNLFWGTYANYYYPLAYESSYIAPMPYYPGGNYAMSGSMLSISPGVGLRWKLGQRLALGMETNAQLFIARERGYYYSQKAGKVVGINAKVVKFHIGFIF